MSKNLFDHTFKNGTRVEVSEAGVTIWDAAAGRWVVDASDIQADNTIRVSSGLKKFFGDGSNHCFESFYPDSPPYVAPKKKKATKKGKKQ